MKIFTILKIFKNCQLTSNIYIPILDDPINDRDIKDAIKDCNKGGYDYTLPVLEKLVASFLPLILMLFNYMFYLWYPLELACSLLITIPIKGNLRLPGNYRGIQMLPSLGVLYDRILSKRLDRWLNVHEEQSGFDKGKSTITQIFTIRLLIEITKETNITLYIGCFDIEN